MNFKFGVPFTRGTPDKSIPGNKNHMKPLMNESAEFLCVKVARLHELKRKMTLNNFFSDLAAFMYLVSPFTRGTLNFQ